MPRRYTSSKVRQAINNYNRAVRNYNREVRAHNARVRANRQRLLHEIRRLNARQTVSVRYVTYRSSVQVLQRSFTRIEEAADRGTWAGGDALFDLAEGETANSIAVLNALEAPSGDVVDDAQVRQTAITTELREISPDLDARWRGALFALHPRNPDAARHFCTSAREILVRILDLKAPDTTVLATWPDVQLTEHKQVPRREKLRFCLAQAGHQDARLATFVEDDINNVMDLFGEFNPATHGEAGRYTLVQLGAIKTRVEGAIQFLHRIVSG